MTDYHNKTLEIAKEYLAKGFRPIPIPHASKRPLEKDWNNLDVNESNIASLFANDNLNVGIVLGSASDGLVDVDLDDKDSIRFAKHFLPSTDAIFGRESNPTSHWLYRVPSAQATRHFKTSEFGMIAEIRGNDSQTVFPGSTHVCGEPIRFEHNGDPGETTWAELENAVSKVAIATVFLKAWTEGNRHSLALSLSGLLVTVGWSEGEITGLIEAICQEAGDGETEDRLECVRTTMREFRIGNPISWRENLTSILSKTTVAAIEKWLPSAKTISSNDNAIQSSLGQFDLLTDASLSDAFADAHSENLKWAGGNWYRRENHIFRKIDPVIVQGMAKEFLQRRFGKMGVYSKAALSKQRINAATELGRHRLWADPTTFNDDPNLVGLADGTVFDIDRNSEPNAQSVVVTKSLATHFHPDAQCPKWLAFLGRIFEGDQELISFLQRAVGYSLTGSVQEQALFILIGKGANGKSTFLNTLLRLFGDYGATIPMQTLMDQGKFGNQTNDLASLASMRFVVASEGEREQKLAECKIKLMTGGDRIKCRYLYGEYFEFDPTFKLWLATNNFPTVSGSDEAIWRRMRVIEFPVSIPSHEQDPHLGASLITELPGILNWALQGYREWKNDGLRPPERVLTSTRSYQDENNVIGQWISSCCDTAKAQGTTSVKLLHESYLQWSQNSGLEPMSAAIFGKELTRMGFGVVKNNKGNKRKGIALITLPDC